MGDTQIVHDITVRESALGHWLWGCTCGANATGFHTREDAAAHCETEHIEPIRNPHPHRPIPESTPVRVTEGRFAGIEATSCGYVAGPMMCINAPGVHGGPHLHVQRSHVQALP